MSMTSFLKAAHSRAGMNDFHPMDHSHQSGCSSLPKCETGSHNIISAALVDNKHSKERKEETIPSLIMQEYSVLSQDKKK